MIFSSTRLEGALLIDIEPIKDQRGFFARTWCRQELAARGLDTEIARDLSDLDILCTGGCRRLSSL